MEEKTIYYISEAAKKVQVENHVLRYWEDELQLPIKRNEMGHRYYTEQDVSRLQEIKLLKEQGLQLKAIRTLLFKMPAMSTDQLKSRDTLSEEGAIQNTVSEESEKQNVVSISGEGQDTLSETDGGEGAVSTKKEEKNQEKEVKNEMEMRKDRLMEMVKERVEEKAEEMAVNKAQRYVVALSKDDEGTVGTGQEYAGVERERKAARLQYLLQHMITEAVKSANRELCTEVKESILKELDYQFRMQEERDDERWKIEEEHYRKIDEMIRERHKPRERLGKNRKKA